jgi:hypothetical protein
LICNIRAVIAREASYGLFTINAAATLSSAGQFLQKSAPVLIPGGSAIGDISASVRPDLSEPNKDQ